MAIISKDTTKKHTIDLTGPQGNAYFLLGTAMNLCKQIGFSELATQGILEDMKNGDYEHLITRFDYHFGDVIDLERQMTKQELLDRLEKIRDGFLDASDRHMIEGMAEDITALMWDINKGGVE